jgi:hypothetical protein
MTNDEPEAGVAVGPGRSQRAGEPDNASSPGAEPTSSPEPAATEARDAAPPPLTSADYSVAFSPRNVAIGLAIVAGIVAFALSRRRRPVHGGIGRPRLFGTDEAD